MNRFEVHNGDALRVLRTLETASAHALVTDPPAGIAFMGAEWDKDKGGRDAWIAWLRDILIEARRVLKPGAHALVWALPRTSHWTATALEDAGFEIRDVGVHLFGQGFPKSHNVSKAIDKAAGATREVVGSKRLSGNAAIATKDKGGTYGVQVGTAPAIDVPINAPATEAAKLWDGWGTALKPAAEHWILARAPMRGTVAANVVEHGTGALNIDACRIGVGEQIRGGGNGEACRGGILGERVSGGRPLVEPHTAGRWPANVTLEHAPDCELVGTRRVRGSHSQGNSTGAEKHVSRATFGSFSHQSTTQHVGEDGLETVDAWSCAPGCAVAALDAQSGDCPSGVAVLRNGGGGRVFGHGHGYATEDAGYTDSGGASRFFYCAKASTSERTENVDANKHPTVKPVELMRWLCRLITPKGGLVLDPFAGSGTTGVAALMEGMRFVGVEQDAESAELARRRVANALGPLFVSAMGGA